MEKDNYTLTHFLPAKPEPNLYKPLSFFCRLLDGFYVQGLNEKRKFPKRKIDEMVDRGTLYPLIREHGFAPGDVLLLAPNGDILWRRAGKNRPGEVIDHLNWEEGDE